MLISTVPDGFVPKFSTIILALIGTSTIASMTNRLNGLLNPKMGKFDENMRYFPSSTELE